MSQEHKTLLLPGSVRAGIAQLWMTTVVNLRRYNIKMERCRTKRTYHKLCPDHISHLFVALTEIIV